MMHDCTPCPYVYYESIPELDAVELYVHLPAYESKSTWIQSSPLPNSFQSHTNLNYLSFTFESNQSIDSNTNNLPPGFGSPSMNNQLGNVNNQVNNSFVQNNQSPNSPNAMHASYNSFQLSNSSNPHRNVHSNFSANLHRKNYHFQGNLKNKYFIIYSLINKQNKLAILPSIATIIPTPDSYITKQSSPYSEFFYYLSHSGDVMEYNLRNGTRKVKHDLEFIVIFSLLFLFLFCSFFFSTPAALIPSFRLIFPFPLQPTLSFPVPSLVFSLSCSFPSSSFPPLLFLLLPFPSPFPYSRLLPSPSPFLPRGGQFQLPKPSAFTQNYGHTHQWFTTSFDNPPI